MSIPDIEDVRVVLIPARHEVVAFPGVQDILTVHAVKGVVAIGRIGVQHHLSEAVVGKACSVIKCEQLNPVLVHVLKDAGIGSIELSQDLDAVAAMALEADGDVDRIPLALERQVIQTDAVDELQHVHVAAVCVVFQVVDDVVAIAETISIDVGVARPHQDIVALATLNDVGRLAAYHGRRIVIDAGNCLGDLHITPDRAVGKYDLIDTVVIRYVAGQRARPLSFELVGYLDSFACGFIRQEKICSYAGRVNVDSVVDREPDCIDRMGQPHVLIKNLHRVEVASNEVGVSPPGAGSQRLIAVNNEDIFRIGPRKAPASRNDCIERNRECLRIVQNGNPAGMLLDCIQHLLQKERIIIRLVDIATMVIGNEDIEERLPLC